MCHCKQPYLYLSYGQRKISSPVQINIFFDTVYLKSDIYTSNKPIFIILMIKGITVHLFKCIYLIIIIITKGVSFNVNHVFLKSFKLRPVQF